MRPEGCEAGAARRCEPGLGDRGWARAAAVAAAAGLGGPSADADSFIPPLPSAEAAGGATSVPPYWILLSNFFSELIFFGD